MKQSNVAWVNLILGTSGKGAVDKKGDKILAGIAQKHNSHLQYYLPYLGIIDREPIYLCALQETPGWPA